MDWAGDGGRKKKKKKEKAGDSLPLLFTQQLRIYKRKKKDAGN